MSESKENLNSRRQFIKKAGRAAAATAMAAAAVPEVSGKDKVRPEGRETTTEKLGEIADQPDNSAFRLDRRMPGWHSDTLGNGGTKFFPEELLKKDKGDKPIYHYFPPPSKKDNPDPDSTDKDNEFFTEPPPYDPRQPTTAEAWHKFNAWILGHGIVDAGDGSNKEFNDLLREIAACARRYNAALYWMRGLHFHENTEDVRPRPPRNPHGDRGNQQANKPWKTAFPDKVSEGFVDSVYEAEREWDRTVEDLNGLLDGRATATSRKFKYIRADMMEVNGYIVSMRVVAQKDAPKDGPRTREIGGSESSHISISSAFSSL